jgi:hypothetical protein
MRVPDIPFEARDNDPDHWNAELRAGQIDDDDARDAGRR